MKSSALLINTSRGAVIDQAALIDALRDHHLTAAGLDVFETEPLPADDPTQRQPDITVARKVLRWEPQVELAEGLERTIPWLAKELAATGR